MAMISLQTSSYFIVDEPRRHIRTILDERRRMVCEGYSYADAGEVNTVNISTAVNYKLIVITIAQFHNVRDWGDSGHLRTSEKNGIFVWHACF